MPRREEEGRGGEPMDRDRGGGEPSDLAEGAIPGLVNWNGGQDYMQRQIQMKINSF